MEIPSGSVRRANRAAWALLALAAAPPSHASMFEGETLDAVANGIAWVVLAIVPFVVLGVFWMLHVMPEKIAEKKHHPQKSAIHTLCLLSLVFGGLLWPIAWLWAYTRPVQYKQAFGTDKHDDYFVEQGALAERGELDASAIAALRDELEQRRLRGSLPPELQRIHERLRVEGTAPTLAPAGPGAA